MSKHSYEEIANSYALWLEFVDPSGLTTEADFEAQSVEEKVEFIKSCFGPDEN